MRRGQGFRFIGAFRAWTDVWIRSGWRVQTHSSTGGARLLDPAGTVILAGEEGRCLDLGRAKAPRRNTSRAAVLLHGLGHHPGAMVEAERALIAGGWAVANLGYASLRRSLDDHAEAASRVAMALTEDGASDVSFIGHSLGGLVARLAMAKAGVLGWKPGRLVLIGSPARGAALADTMSSFAPYRTLTGACGQTVTVAGASDVAIPSCVGIGVIAGGTGGRGFNPLLDGDNDGVVTVAEARMPGAEDAFLRVRALHTPLAAKTETVAAAMTFLSHGRLAA